jgi:hypothetical protein
VLGLLDAVPVRLVRLVMRREVLRLGHLRSLRLLLLRITRRMQRIQRSDERGREEDVEGSGAPRAKEQIKWQPCRG